MPEIEVSNETQTPQGWSYQVNLFDQGKFYTFQVTLSHPDYDLWCKGALPPYQVVEKVFHFLLTQEPAGTILKKFDCSVIRRFYPEIDQALPPGDPDLA